MNTLVSVIVPCYNQEKYISEALNSIMQQTYDNWECLVINDGSTDNSEKIIDQFVTNDARFISITKKNGGVSSARNFGLENAKGKYIQFLDADDFLDKNKLLLSLNTLISRENENEKIVISNFSMVSHDGKQTSPPFCILNEKSLNFDGFLLQWNVTFSIQVQCGFFEASLFKDVRFPEMLSAQEDWVVWVHLFKLHNKCIFIDEPLAYYRKNPDSRMMTLGIDDNQLKAVICFKNILSFDEYFDFSYNLISRYYTSDTIFRTKLIDAKHSNSYQTGLMVKKGFKSVGLLQFSKRVFNFLLQLKTR